MAPRIYLRATREPHETQPRPPPRDLSRLLRRVTWKPTYERINTESHGIRGVPWQPDSPRGIRSHEFLVKIFLFPPRSLRTDLELDI